jgi:outer membrane protein OmpA-like peptidoglycan-associated protein
MADIELEQLKKIILKDDNARVINVVQENARSLVGEVFTEALNDRQKKDKSVAKVLTPIVENAVERSITTHRDKFVSYLYPLVGSLIRKSVAAFLGEFLEKTNNLIENSFTYKGLKWRIKAKQAGVSFAQYVVSQTYIYRVEQVFLIHAETGLLLNSVSLEPHVSTDADLISSMLTAINDFIADSFGKENGTALDVIKTANFNLVIKDGPFAVIAAAVTGNMSAEVPAKLQQTLEDIHHLYNEELQNFTGDASTVANVEQQLRDCLITQSKEDTNSTKTKKPWYAVILVCTILTLFSYQLYQSLKPDIIFNALKTLDDEPGIIVRKINKTDDHIYQISLLRDPSAIPIKQWLQNNDIPLDRITISEQLYHSADNKITKQKIEQLLKVYAISSQWVNNTLILNGRISSSDIELIKQQINLISPDLKINFDKVALITPQPLNTKDNDVLSDFIFKEKIGQISSVQINFNAAESTLNEQEKAKLQQQIIKIKALLQYAHKNNKQLGLLIIGTSDNTGLKQNNLKISKQRAQIVRNELIKGGLKPENLYAIGIGEIPISNITNEIRKVLFTVIYL